jgi:hypothetical protein
MYNLDFSQAHSVFSDYETLNPKDALGPVSNAAAYLFDEFDRLHILQSEFFVDDNRFKRAKALTPDPATREHFYQESAKAEEIANQALSRTPQDRNALFATVMNLGLRADYEALIEKRYISSLHDMKTGRLIAEKLVSLDPTYYDAYLAVGVENYMLSLKPAPVRWVLNWGGAETDKFRGIEKLRLTAEKGRLLKPYARLLLAVAALRDKDKNTAREILADLSRHYPNNKLYAEELAKLN